MPWTLTIPMNAGDLDVGTYNEIKITQLNVNPNLKEIMVVLEYGNTVGGEWVPGITPRGKVNSVIISDLGGPTDYTNLVTSHLSNNGELTYDATKRALYEWLSSKGFIAAGTIT